MAEFTRRQFIRGAAALGAGALTLGRHGFSLATVPRRARGATAGRARVKWGIYPEPQGSQTVFDALLNVEDLLNRKCVIIRGYQGMDGDLMTGADRLVQRGTIPYRSFHAWMGSAGENPIRWSAIANGKHDRWLKDQAGALADWGKPMYISFHHEPENDVDGFEGTGEAHCGTPAEFKAAYHHIRDIFTPARNLTWIVALMHATYAGKRGGYEQFMPGTRFDLLGVDGYNRGAYFDGPDQWLRFGELYGPAIAAGRNLGKKLFIGESASVEEGGDKAAWVRGALNTLKGWDDMVEAVCWSHLYDAHTADGEVIRTYRMDSSRSALAAFREIASDPYFN